MIRMMMAEHEQMVEVDTDKPRVEQVSGEAKGQEEKQSQAQREGGQAAEEMRHQVQGNSHSKK
jgi:hypothetical protein